MPDDLAEAQLIERPSAVDATREFVGRVELDGRPPIAKMHAGVDSLRTADATSLLGVDSTYSFVKSP